MKAAFIFVRGVAMDIRRERQRKSAPACRSVDQRDDRLWAAAHCDDDLADPMLARQHYDPYVLAPLQ
jgi:hypothetical protein